jgi:hypothetical protein
MALPITHRWIAVGNLNLRNRKGVAKNAPSTTIDEVMRVASDLLVEDTHVRRYGKNESRVMWFSNMEERDGFYWFLAQTGDQNVTGFSFLNFLTFKSRDVNKRDNEGGHYTAHVAISKKQLTKTSGHLLLAERVPGIHLASLKDHLTWLTNEPRLQKTYQDDKGRDRLAAAVFQVDGYESGTIRRHARYSSCSSQSSSRHQRYGATIWVRTARQSG